MQEQTYNLCIHAHFHPERFILTPLSNNNTITSTARMLPVTKQVSAVANWPTRLYCAVNGAWRSHVTNWSGRLSKVLSTYSWQTMIQFITFWASTFLKLSRYHILTIDYRSKFSKSRVSDKVPEGSTLNFCTYLNFLKSQYRIGRKNPTCQEPARSVHFDRTPTCDRQTDRQTQTQGHS